MRATNKLETRLLCSTWETRCVRAFGFFICTTLAAVETSTAVVNYVPGLEQPGHWNSSVGGAVGYTSKNQRWRMVVTSAYGIDAIRSDGRGGYNLGMMFQYNFGRTAFASERAFKELKGARVPLP